MKKGAFLSTVRVAFPYTVPVMAGYLVLSVAYGILMQSKGCSPVWALLVSLLAYSGSMQYAAVPYFAAPFDPLGAFVLSLTINARYFFCSMGMLNRFADAGKSRPLLFYMLSDESFAIAATTPPPPEVSSGAFYTAVFVLNYLYWGIGTLAGGLLGSLLPFAIQGLDFTLTAMYVAMLTDMLRQRSTRRCALVGAGCSLAALLVFGSGRMVIPALGLIFLIFIPTRRKLSWV